MARVNLAHFFFLDTLFSLHKRKDKFTTSFQKKKTHLEKLLLHFHCFEVCSNSRLWSVGGDRSGSKILEGYYRWFLGPYSPRNVLFRALFKVAEFFQLLHPRTLDLEIESKSSYKINNCSIFSLEQ